MRELSHPQPSTSGPCPGPEALAAWLDGDRRRDLTEHLVDCADCRADALAAEGARRERRVDLALHALARQVGDPAELSPCPGPVVVAAWIGGERAQPGLVEHFADCGPCRADLLAAAGVAQDLALEAALEAQPWRGAEAAGLGPCPSPDALAARVEAGELAEFADHLARCAPCRADALAAAEVRAAVAGLPSVSRAAAPAPLEPELAEVLSFTRRSRRLRRIALPAPTPSSANFTPAVAIAAALLLAISVFALQPRPQAHARVAAQDLERVRFAWVPEPTPPPRPSAVVPQAPAEEQAWEAETDFEVETSQWSAWEALGPGTPHDLEREPAPAPAPDAPPPAEPDAPDAPVVVDAPEPTPPPGGATTGPQRVRPGPAQLAAARETEVEARGVRIRRGDERVAEVDRVRPGDRIFASRSGGAVRSPAGLSLYLAPRAEVGWRDDGVELVRGRAYLEAPADVRVTTEAGAIDVRGEVLLAVKGRQAGVQVVAGYARYTDPQGTTAIEPGRSAVVGPRGAQLQPALPQAPRWLVDLKGNLREPLPTGLGGPGPLGPSPGHPPLSGSPGGVTPPGGTPLGPGPGGVPGGGPAPAGDGGRGRGGGANDGGRGGGGRGGGGRGRGGGANDGGRGGGGRGGGGRGGRGGGPRRR